MWKASLDVRRSRFGHHRSPPNELVTQHIWFRSPKEWSDWLAWSALSAEVIHNKIAPIKSFLPHNWHNVLPWSHFLECFHYEKGENRFQNILAIIGEPLLKGLLPYSQGQVWEAKAPGKTYVSFEIIASSLSQAKLSDAFKGLEPAQWYQFPETFNLRLRQRQEHAYLGKAGCLWQCHKGLEEPYPIMISDEEVELELPFWLEDAIYPAERGELLARCPLENIWDRPSFLPISQMIPHKDTVFLSSTHAEQSSLQPVRRSHDQRGGLRVPLSSRIDQQSREDMYRRIFASANVETQKQAQRLLVEWSKWVKQPDINKLFTRMVEGRLASGSVDALAGVVALSQRLEAHGYGNAYKPIPHHYDELQSESLEFVRTSLPKAFLRDLILSEILICWYWRKHVASVPR